MTEADTGAVDQDGPDPKRRRLLTLGVAGVGAAGVAALAAPMLSSFAPSRRAKAAGAPVEVDISKLEAGQMMTVEWRGKPVWIVNRTDEALASLGEVTGELADPASEMPQQPDYVSDETRSIKPNMMVMGKLKWMMFILVTS